MVLAVIVLLYIAAALLYLGVNRKTPLAAASNTDWSDTANSRPPASVAKNHTFNVKQKPLLEPAQRVFYAALKQAVTANHEVFIKIRIADLLTDAQRGHNEAVENFKKIANEYFDFIICRGNSLTIVAAIRMSGLSDQSHSAVQDTRAIQDKLLRAACKAEKIPLIVVKEKPLYDIAQIKKLISLL